MLRRVVECVANFSEGRRADVVDALVAAVAGGDSVAVLHCTADPDHNRCVITFAGSPEGVSAAAVRATAKAAELIDLRSHRGVHPRLGAADVVPFVPVTGVTLEDCAELARRTGEEIWRNTGVPVYFYEAAARVPGRLRLEDVRRGEFEGVAAAALADPSRRPDIGGPVLHRTAGAVIVGARKVLIAWNVDLATPDVSAARAIARIIRASSGGFPHVKALGLSLESRGLSQVSMNLTDYEQTPMHVVFEAIRREAAARGIGLAGTEIIGLLPRAALEAAAAHFFAFGNFRPDLVLEQRIDEALPAGLDELLDGSPPALAGAIAAGVGLRVCYSMGRDPAVFREHRRYFSGLIQRSGVPPDPERVAGLERDLRFLREECPPPHASEVETGLDFIALARSGNAGRYHRG